MNSVIDEKKGIFNKLSVFTSLKEIELKPINGFNSINSINNDIDPLPFLLDLSTSLVGTDGLQDKLGLLLTQFIDTYNTKSKEILKSNFLDFNQNQALPTSFVNSGIDIPLTSIDSNNNLKTPKNDPIGELIYDDSKPNLQTKLRDAITSPNNIINFGNINIIYNQNTDTVNIKPTSNVNIGSFISNYIDSFSGINKKEFTTDILNEIYGLKSKLQNKTIAELNNENTINKILDKLINESDLLLSDEDIEEINRISEEIYKGVNQINFGCGIINNELTIDQLNDIANKLNNSTNPNEVGNLFTKLFIDSLDENNDESNTTNLKDSFLKKIINIIKINILKDLLFSPEKKSLFIFANIFENKNISELNALDFVNNNKNICNCLVKDIISDINEYIFNLVKTEIIEITKPALKKIIIEKINNYKLILTSLTSI
jgi:hypothetical protein